MLNTAATRKCQRTTNVVPTICTAVAQCADCTRPLLHIGSYLPARPTSRASQYYQGRPRERFLILGAFPAIIGHDGNKRGGLVLEPAATGTVHAVFSRRGDPRDSWYGNFSPRATFPREPATTGILPAGTNDHRNLPRKLSPWNLTKRE